MKRIVLISCAKEKRATKAKADELYISQHFKLELQYARKLKPDAIFILSAKYGLLALDDEVEPYDMTLITMRVKERKAWANRVLLRLQEYADLQHDHFIIFAGIYYRQYLLPHLSSYEVPLKGLPYGKQVNYLMKQVKA